MRRPRFRRQRHGSRRYELPRNPRLANLLIASAIRALLLTDDRDFDHAELAPLFAALGVDFDVYAWDEKGDDVPAAKSRAFQRRRQRAVINALQERLEEVDEPIIDVTDVEPGLAALRDQFALEDVELRILLLMAMRGYYQVMNASLEIMGDIGRRELYDIVADITCSKASAVRTALLRSSALHRIGLLTKARTSGGLRSGIEDWLEPYDLLPEMIFESGGGLAEWRKRLFVESSRVALPTASFQHIARFHETARQVLAHGVDCRQAGLNILLFGDPGVGKTELAVSLAESAKLNLLEVGSRDEDGDSVSGPRRLQSLRIAQEIFDASLRQVLVLDEAEDVLPPAGFFRHLVDGDREYRKHAFARMLEQNPVPTIWIANSISDLDPALLRRFTLVFEVPNPPRSVREVMLRDRLSGQTLSPEWVSAVAEHGGVSPAQVERMSTVAELIKADSPDLEGVLGEMLTQTFRAMDLPPLPRVRRSSTGTYDPGLINADQDIQQILAGMRRNRRGRVLLWGPPGTGKTAFAEQLAREVDLPLHRKRASDLMSMWVGGTEKNIARMFTEADQDNAVLLLDEADSLLASREGAQRSWEVTQVNELLTHLESFEGVFIAATNWMTRLDPAVMRRFDIKLHMDYLKPEQVAQMFRRALKPKRVRVDHPALVRAMAQETLTPGDFAAVARKAAVTGVSLTADWLATQLVGECAMKPEARQRPIGFTATI